MTSAAQPVKPILDYIYDHEATHPDAIYLTQPTGGGQVIDYTWRQVLDQARRMATHLRDRGLGNGDRVAILSKNCAHFFMAELAVWMAGCTTVAIFPTERAETVQFVLEHSEAKLLFVGKLDTWEQQRPGVAAGMPRIAFPLSPNDADCGEKWDDIAARTQPMAGRPARAADDLAMLIYTSGSTGQPKGAMHSFGHISAVGAASLKAVDVSGADRYLSYLPLAHVFERGVVECATFVSGARVFFAESLDTFIADLRRARPTVFHSVPRLWLKFQHGVFAKMPPKKLDFLLSIPILGKIVGRKVLDGLGLDQVRIALSGSAPIPAELITWYRRLGLNLLEGYAMTEDFAYSHFSQEGKSAPGYVGMPMPGVEVKISEEGEVLIKSPGQMVGYYKRPDLNAEAFTDDGFFRTGDKGERRADGMLKITGRVKEQFKTAKGKYVAPAPIENRLNNCPLIELSMVSGVGQSAAYAMVVLAEEQRKQVGTPEARAHIETELGKLLDDVNAELPDYEHLRMLVIAPEPWSIENGFLTPTMKIKRSRIESVVGEKLNGWYEAKGKVLWG
ncbi:MAG: AMP-binding protein [Burkholderiaceae bacterium]|nr:AMP-binding protein [Burkholderiaceae bacterium]